MASELPIRGTPGVQKGAELTGASKPADPRSGIAFRALLDDLEGKAKALEQRSQTVEKPEDLPGAVAGARDSLADLLSIRDRLIEAYREARAQDGVAGAIREQP